MKYANESLSNARTTDVDEVLQSQTGPWGDATVGSMWYFNLNVGFDQFFVVGFDCVRVSAVNKTRK